MYAGECGGDGVQMHGRASAKPHVNDKDSPFLAQVSAVTSSAGGHFAQTPNFLLEQDMHIVLDVCTCLACQA